MDTRPASIAESIDAGLHWQGQQTVYGIQNDELFKLNFMPKKGGIRMAETTLKKKMDTSRVLPVHEIFTKYVQQ